MVECDCCLNEFPERSGFTGSIAMEYDGESMDFMGNKIEKPVFAVMMSMCQGCAIKVMQGQMGILTSG